MSLDRTITAYADPNYAVLFYYPNGGTLNNSTYLISTGNYPGSIRSTSTEYLQTVSYGRSADPFNATTFGLTRLGYIFKGWAIATSADGITSTVLDQDTQYAATTYVSYSNKNNNVTNAHNFPCCLYAAWTANTYTIKYNGNGNTGGSTSSSTHTYDEAKPLTENGFTKTDYIFQGWATSASGPIVYTNGQYVKNLTSTNGGVINLYAVWGKSLIRNDVLPYIRISSTNQPMMPRIFYNGAWHWYLMNINPEQIVSGRASISVNGDVAALSADALTDSASSPIATTQSFAAKIVQPHTISADVDMELAGTTKTAIVLANAIKANTKIEIKDIANFLSTAYATMNNTALLTVTATNNASAAPAVRGDSQSVITIIDSADASAADTLSIAGEAVIPYWSSGSAKTALVLYLSAQNSVEVTSTVDLSKVNYLLMNVNTNADTTATAQLTSTQCCCAAINADMSIDSNIAPDGIICWEYPQFVDGTLLITQVYSAIQNDDYVKIDSEDAQLITFCDWDGKVLYSCAVRSGDNCPDPIKNGSIAQPVGREPSAYYTYGELLGWSESPDGEVNSTILDNVSQNLKLYAIYKKETRYYTVNFYDGDTLMKTEKVTYGTTVTPPTDTEKDGYTFVGWNPDNFVITQDTDFIGVWEKEYILPETEVTFSKDPIFGIYDSKTLNLSKLLQLGETYIVEWDGTKYSCVAKSVKYAMNGGSASFAVTLGNAGVISKIAGGTVTPNIEPSGEPFLLGNAENSKEITAYTQDTSTTHTISICAAPSQ